MVHVAWAPPPLEQILELMRPGDILTHCFTGLSSKLVDDDGRILDAAVRACERGIVFDVGHGSGSFSWASAETLLEHGMRPDVISSDIHQLCDPRPDVRPADVPEQVPRARDAAARRDRGGHGRGRRRCSGSSSRSGTLKVGANADVALFELERGSFDLYDVHHERREGRALLRNALTLVGGRRLPAKAPPPPAPWLELTPAQRERDAALRRPPTSAPLLERPEDLAPPTPLEPPEGCSAGACGPDRPIPVRLTL